MDTKWDICDPTIVEKLQDALGPYEGWKYLLENKDPTGNVRLRIIELDTQ